ncbi:hypothetical protein [Methylobacter marinus]|uniref:hypothetical protein n=1 Tax=Methylobacter marinus TaxID=34058 RepID=UPI0003612609|nr:hypothetical protein [Methylobacter marinus]
MKMETTNPPAKQSLFSALAHHEVAQSEGNTIESNQGLRPRLPNRFEMIDANMDTPPFEEQQSETSLSSPKPGFREESSEAIGLRTVKSSFPQENSLQPKVSSQYQVPPSELARTLGQPNYQIPEAEPQFKGVWTSDHENKFSSGANKFMPPAPNSLQLSHANELPKEKKTITEKLTTVERETLREIHALKPSIPQSGRQTGLIPKMQPVQTLISPAIENAHQPNIEIHIGRIEVRANIQATQPKPEKTAAPATNDGALQAYLQSRSRGARS